MAYFALKITTLLLSAALAIGNPDKAADTTKNHSGRAAKVEIVSNDKNTLNTRSISVPVTDNYFHVDKTNASLWNGKHWSSADFPLKVFLSKTDSKLFKSDYKKYVDYAFKVWEKADRRIKFVYVDNKEDANVTLTFENNLMEKYDENFLGLTDYELTRNNKIVSSAIQISLLKFNGKRLKDGEIKATIIHELGHAVGLGHSENDMDIMYPYIDPGFSAGLDYLDLSTGDEMSVKSLMDMGFRFQYTQR